MIRHDFSKISRSMCSIFEKEVKFKFDALCFRDFVLFKWSLIEAPILIVPTNV